VILPTGLRYLCPFQGKYVSEPHNHKPVSPRLGSALEVEVCVWLFDSARSKSSVTALLLLSGDNSKNL